MNANVAGWESRTILRHKLCVILIAGIVGFSQIAQAQVQSQALANGSAAAGAQLDELYHQAQREFMRANYPKALEIMERFIKLSKQSKYPSDKLVIIIDKVGFIYLRVRHDPVKAIGFFNAAQKDLAFSEDVSDVIDEWLGAAMEWQKLGKLPENVNNPNQLFELGKSNFEKGNEKLRYPMDKAGNANFHIAASYLIPFIANYDDHPRIADALLMMGKIRRHITLDPEYWTENFYLKEVIRRFPHTDVAQQAYQALQESVHFGYSGSGGDSTPPSMLRMLEEYKKLADPIGK